MALGRNGVLLGSVRKPRPLRLRQSSTPKRRWYSQQDQRILALGGKSENRCDRLNSRGSDLTGGFRSARVWNQFQAYRGFSVNLV
jgi:hypothetical protein